MIAKGEYFSIEYLRVAQRLGCLERDFISVQRGGAVEESHLCSD